MAEQIDPLLVIAETFEEAAQGLKQVAATLVASARQLRQLQAQAPRNLGTTKLDAADAALLMSRFGLKRLGFKGSAPEFSAEQRYLVSVLSFVAQTYNVALGDIMGESLTRNHTEPRRVAMWLIKQVTRLSYPKLGGLFGRDHTTVMSAVRRVRERIAQDETVALKMAELEAKACKLPARTITV